MQIKEMTYRYAPAGLLMHWQRAWPGPVRARGARSRWSTAGARRGTPTRSTTRWAAAWLASMPDYAEFMQEDYTKFMQEVYAKFMQEDYAKYIQEDYAKFMQEDYAKFENATKFCKVQIF